ncbi:NAD(P)H-dependent oxidoreductase [soil metagenome]
MNILIVFAHPEPASLNGSLKDFAVRRLQAAGHSVRVSDLYAMHWKAGVDAGDNTDHESGAPFDAVAESSHAFANGTQSADIALEQDKLRWADAVILQFPLWWFSMPAILKGWIDRVYAYGFAYGVGEHSDRHWGDRYGEGTMKGKRAMLMVTTGGWASHYSQRGVNGALDDLLFPIQHGVLYYPGFDVLPPFVVHQTGSVDDARFASACDELAERLDELFTTRPIAYRPQNGGDYLIPDLTLRPDIAADRSGLAIHTATAR